MEPDDNSVERILDAAQRRGVALDTAQATVLRDYAAGVIAAPVNLTAARTIVEAVDILVLPSLPLPLVWPHDDPPRVVLDIGSGNGFPGVVGAVVWPSARVVLVERRGKKARAIDACLGATGIANAEALGIDAREVKHDHGDLLGACDVVTARAVGPLDVVTKIAAPLLAPGGRVAHWKGDALHEAEEEAGREVARSRGLTVPAALQLGRGPSRIVIYERPSGRRR